ncbi:MAG: STAS/SEC14 domain-containing protein [Pseudomonadales bacterium]|nr:STAS/SEC14 domain-containing protein [Pseudomonadales bacterium]
MDHPADSAPACPVTRALEHLLAGGMVLARRNLRWANARRGDVVREDAQGGKTEMISFDQTTDNILIVNCSGKLTETDIRRLETRLVSTDAGVVTRLLLRMSEFEGFEDASTLVDDIKVEKRFRNAFSRVACVGDKRWEKWMTRLASPFTRAEIEYFDVSDAGSAMAWLRADDHMHVEFDVQEGVVLVEPRAPLSKEDFDTIRGRVDEFLRDHDELNGLVVHTREFPGWKSFDGMVSHLRFIRDMHSKIKRVALVTDTKLRPLAESLGKHFVSAEVETFDYDDLETARAWVTEAFVH